MKYDLIIIGSGPAGYTAAIYAARYKLKTLLIGAEAGGMASEAWEIGNYPGFENISGLDLMEKFEKQAKNLGVEIIHDKAVFLCGSNNNFSVQIGDGRKFEAKKVILATGTQKRKLEVPGENEFLGRGVSYCATCDAAFFRDKVVGVVGGGDSALTAALLLSKFAKKVYLLVRSKIKAEPHWRELVEKNEKIEIKMGVTVEKLEGDQLLRKAKLSNGEELEIDGLFVEIGSVPTMIECKDIQIELTEGGYIKVDKFKRTNVKGIFAAGDITDTPLRQIVTAAADGAIAAYSAYNEIVKGE